MKTSTVGKILLPTAALLAIAVGMLHSPSDWAVGVCKVGVIGVLLAIALVNDPISRRVTAESPARRVGALACLGAGVLLVSLNATALLVVLPALARAVPGLTPDGVWMLAATYLLGCAASIPIAGPLANRIGRQRTFQLGLALFASAGLVAGGAAGWVFVALALQGVGTALATGPGTAATVRTLFPDFRRGLVVAIYGAIAVFLMLGPLLGGALVATDWSAAFTMNLATAAIALVLTRYLVPDSRDVGARASIDPFGPALFAVGLFFVSQGLINSSVRAPAAGVFTAIGGVALAVSLTRAVWRIFEKMSSAIPTPRFGSARLPLAGAANAALLFVGCGGAVTAMFLFAFVRELPPLELGWAVLPIPVGVVCGHAVGEWLVDRVPPPAVIAPAVLLVAMAALSMFALTAEGGYWLPTGLALAAGALFVGAGVRATARWIRPRDLLWGSLEDARTFLREVRFSTAAVGAIFTAALVESYRDTLLGSPSGAAGSGVFPELIPPAGPALAFADKEAFVQAMGRALVQIGAYVFVGCLVVSVVFFLVTRPDDHHTT